MFPRAAIVAFAIFAASLGYSLSAGGEVAEAAQSTLLAQCDAPVTTDSPLLDLMAQTPIEPQPQISSEQVHRTWRWHCVWDRYTYGQPVRTCCNDRIVEGEGTTYTHRRCSIRIVERTGFRRHCQRIPVYHFGGHAYRHSYEVGELTTFQYA